MKRGAAYADGKVFFNTLDNHTIAVDAESGKEVWNATVGDINHGESLTRPALDGRLPDLRRRVQRRARV